MRKTRWVVATLLGGAFGTLCMFLQRYDVRVSFWPVWPAGIFSQVFHAVMGFAIGVSGLRIHWALHGILWGFLFGISLTVGYWGEPLSILVLLGSVILKGFLVELITSRCLALKRGQVMAVVGGDRRSPQESTRWNSGVIANHFNHIRKVAL